MEAALLQELVTLTAADGVTSLSQSAHQYLDVGQNEDLVFYLDVRNVSPSGVTISYETSPTPQNSGFLAMIAPTLVTTARLVVSRAAFSTAAVPPARYVRWRLGLPSGGAGPWNMTFRVWVACYGYR
jgi:hypothetical protein